MTSISVRQSGGANIVSTPKTIVQMLGLSVGSKLDITVEENREFSFIEKAPKTVIKKWQRLLKRLFLKLRLIDFTNS